MDQKKIKKLAWILVNHSTKVRPGDSVIIQGFIQAKPLLREVYREVLRKGAYPRLKVSFEDFAYDYYELASDRQLKHLSKIDLYEIDHVDVVIAIGGNLNSRYLSGIDSRKFSLRNKSLEPLFNKRVDNTRWVATRFPATGLAQNAGMSIQQYSGFLFRATNKDWNREKRKQMKIKNLFDRARKVRIVGRETDITIDISNRKGILCYGQFNMPDGEVFYSPNERKTEGHILFNYPAIYNGHEVENVKLWFKKGKVVKFTCSSNRKFFQQMIDTDDGARYLGELGIGMNDQIRNFTKDVLLDEKMGGTIHLALGRAYKENGGTNKSAIHWDIVKDLRKKHGGGEIYVDGRLVNKDGEWKF
ncbi:aminopeptidase [Candidatus Woesearchaeota archaeon]|nr:aminopeptidase [Candidatus Woesearchaeota archaeon]